MKNNKGNIIPKGFFSKTLEIITTKDALKGVIPVDWDKVFKERKDSNNQIIKLVKPKIFD